ncbi:MAG: hypothetical protein J0I31_02765 [Rhizobiales bacterium]|nr:hypothetical protein [Hyphomicrobiales bacterium]
MGWPLSEILAIVRNGTLTSHHPRQLPFRPIEGQKVLPSNGKALMPKKTKTSYSSSDIIKLLKTMKKDYRSERANYRSFLRALSSKAMTLVVELRKNKKARNELSETIGTFEVEKLPFHVMRYIMGATTVSQKKLADKRARAMVYLHDVLGVPPAEFYREIRARGGFEKLARLAAEHRREDMAEESSIAVSNDNEPAVNVEFHPKAKAKLSGSKEGAELKLYAVKRKNGLEITRVVDQTKKASA